MDLEFIKSKTEEVGECWIWQGCVGSSGYPIMKVEGAPCQTVRRVAYRLKEGALNLAYRQPVITTCKEKLCVNPDHLKASSNKEVSKLAGAAGRMSGVTKGAKIAKDKRENASKLPGGMETARIIRMSDETGPVLALRYGIDKSLVNRIKNGQSWKDYSNPFMGLMA